MTLLARLTVTKRTACNEFSAERWQRFLEILERRGFEYVSQGVQQLRFKRGSLEGNMWSYEPQRFCSELIVSFNGSYVTYKHKIDCYYQDIVEWEILFYVRELPMIGSFVANGVLDRMHETLLKRVRLKLAVLYWGSFCVLGRKMTKKFWQDTDDVAIRRHSYGSLIKRSMPSILGFGP